MRLFAAAIVLFTPMLAWAEPIVWRPDDSPAVQITADEMTYDSKGGFATVRGDVRLTQGDRRLSCTTAVIHYRAKAAKGMVIDHIECEP